MVGNVAQVYSPYMYPASSGPRYLPAMIANSIFVLVTIICCGALYIFLRWENQKLAAAQMQMADEDDEKGGDLKSDARARAAHPEALDPSFRYML